MSRKMRNNPLDSSESDSDEEETSVIESSFNESNAANETNESSKENLEISGTDEELEESKEESSVENSRAADSKLGESYLDASAISSDGERSAVNQDQSKAESYNSTEHSINTSNAANDSQVDSSREVSKNTANNDEESESESSDDEIVYRPRHSVKNRIQDDSSDDEEEKVVVNRRRTFYQEHPEGDTDDPVEDQAFSKATRRSIYGGPSIKLEAASVEQIDTDESDSDIIISDSEDEDKENTHKAQNSPLSSTIRSPLKDQSNSINSSSEASLNVSDVKVVRVPRFVYEQEIRKRDDLQNQIKSAESSKALYAGLPDGGAKLMAFVVNLKKELEDKNAEIKQMVIDEEESISNRIKRSINEDPSYNPELSEEEDEASNIPKHLVADDVQPKYTGKVGMKNFLNQKALTVEKLQNIQQSLDERPSDDSVAEPPKYLKVELMKHQLHAIKFMMWRESQKPRGGLLADDMGLGKTLTAIALVMKQEQLLEEKEDDESSEDEGRSEWIAQGRKDLRAGGTLIICPASLMNQWEYEIKNKVKRGALDVSVFHGVKRPARARELAKFDVVITTYQIVVSEHKNEGCLFDLRWDRIILDEGHVIRNHRSKQNEAVCALEGKNRWVLTGTPVHNKEFDMYAAIKFLRCAPFDDLSYWKTWIEGKKGSSSPRLQTLLKSILLRRTKQQLMESGEIKTLPQKIFEEIKVKLNTEERKIYFKLSAYSKAVFARFLMQQQDKHQNFTYDRNEVQRIHTKLTKAYNVDREVKANEILVLLLRLRQICCHAGLIKQALENFGMVNDDTDEVGDDSTNVSDAELIRQLNELKITSECGDESRSAPIDEDVFNMDIPSSKLEKMMEILREKIEEGDDKIIIVSQWVGVLDIVKGLMEIEGIHSCELSGRIPVKKRNDIVVDFNRKTSKTRVMLLSITAGGVGLNLVGANMLFILDPHWNPQIEQQAQDRIYRFGQEKNVKVIKFICDDTIEEEIVKIQQNKLELATSTLTGAKSNATKLTLDDLKSLFGMDHPH